MPEQRQIVRWEEPPPPGKKGRPNGGGASVYDAVAGLLRANPGRWALIREHRARATLGLASEIGRGRWACFQPAGDFEAVSRRADGIERIYARYVGHGGPR